MTTTELMTTTEAATMHHCLHEAAKEGWGEEERVE
jgi:hypothetical protein